MMADDDNGAGAGAGIVGRTDGAADEGLGAEDAEVVAGDETGPHQDGRRIGSDDTVEGRQTHAGLVGEAAIGGDALEWAGIGLKLAGEIPGEQAVRADVDSAGNAAVFRVAESYQLVRIWHGKIAEH